MIIKNLSEQLRKQNWTSVVIEIAVVVIGILIAFQIEEWNTQREERRQEKISLQAILRDLEIGGDEYRNHLAALEREHQTQLQILALMQGEQTLHAANRRQGLWILMEYKAMAQPHSATHNINLRTRVLSGYFLTSIEPDILNQEEGGYTNRTGAEKLRPLTINVTERIQKQLSK